MILRLTLRDFLTLRGARGTAIAGRNFRVPDQTTGTQ